MTFAVRILIAVIFLLPAGERAALAGHGFDNMFCNPELTFGTFGIANNNAVHSITVGTDGSATYDAAMIDGPVAPTRVECALDTLTPNTALAITITDTTISLDGLGGNPQFTINNYTHNSPVSDGAGNATLFIGARLSTDGSGLYYPTGNYSGSYDITIVF